MTVYSDLSGRRAAQIVGDLATVALIVVFVWLGVLIRDAVLVLTEVGRTIQRAGDGFSGTMTDAGNTLGGVPVIGSGIRGPFDAASDAGSTLAQAGVAQQEAVGAIATTLGIAVAAAPILIVLLVWALTRFRFIRTATELRAMSRLPEGAELLALRALTTAPGRSLRGVEAPLQGWRDRRPAVISALAALELREGGLLLSDDFRATRT